MTTSAPTTFDPAAVLAELGLPPTATVRDLLRAGAARVVMGHLASLLERADLKKLTYLERPTEGWTFDGPVPTFEEAEEAAVAAEWLSTASATAKELTDAALFEVWQASPHLVRAIGLMAEAQRRAAREHNAERGVA
ncbi:MAG: hypothetical protein U1E17_21050 [Geminicoccaceae bacterium]